MNTAFEAVVGAAAGRLSLADRGRVRVTGSDRARFLNGMLSNEVEGLGTGSLGHSLQLDRKGHVLADLWVWVHESEIVLDTAPGTESALIEILEKHVVADDVELSSLGDEWTGVSLEGPGVRDVAAAALAKPPGPGAFVIHGAVAIGNAGALTEEGLRIVGPHADVSEFVGALALPEITPEQAEVLRVERGLSRWGVDLDARTFPQEARLEETAVSFTKGCYIGQEIVARIHSRGAVNRLLVKLGCDALAPIGAPIRHDGREVGSVTSSVISPSEGPLALGTVKCAAAEAGTELVVGDGIAAQVIR